MARGGVLQKVFAAGMTDEDEDLHPAQIAAIRKMTAGQRLDAAVEMMHAARRFQAAALGVIHPEWSREQIDAEVRRRWLYAES